MRSRAQAVLEFTVTFVIMMVLLFGLLSLWKKWADRIIDRQRAYNLGRVGAGDPKIINPDYQPPAY